MYNRRKINLVLKKTLSYGNCRCFCIYKVDGGLNDSNIHKNDTHVDFNYKNLDNCWFVNVNSLPAVSKHLTPKQYVDDAINETTLVRICRNSNFDNNEIFNMLHINLNFDPTNYNHKTI